MMGTYKNYNVLIHMSIMCKWKVVNFNIQAPGHQNQQGGQQQMQGQGPPGGQMMQQRTPVSMQNQMGNQQMPGQMGNQMPS